eukprot:g4174.t1
MARHGKKDKKKKKKKGKRGKQNISDYERVSGWEIEEAERLSQHGGGFAHETAGGTTAASDGVDGGDIDDTGAGKAVPRRKDQQMTQEQNRRRNDRKRLRDRQERYLDAVAENRRQKRLAQATAHREHFGVEESAPQVHPRRITYWGPVNAAARHKPSRRSCTRRPVPNDDDVDDDIDEADSSDETGENNSDDTAGPADPFRSLVSSIKRRKATGGADDRLVQRLLKRRSREQAGREEAGDDDEGEDRPGAAREGGSGGEGGNDMELDETELEALGMSAEDVKQALEVHRQLRSEGRTLDDVDESDAEEAEKEGGGDGEDEEAEDEAHEEDVDEEDEDEEEDGDEEEDEEEDGDDATTDADNTDSDSDGETCVRGNDVWREHFCRDALSNEQVAQLSDPKRASGKYEERVLGNAGEELADSDQEEQDADDSGAPSFTLRFSEASHSFDRATGVGAPATKPPRRPLEGFGTDATLSKACGIPRALAAKWAALHADPSALATSTRVTKKNAKGALPAAKLAGLPLPRVTTPLQRHLLPALCAQKDVHFAARTPGNAEELRALYMLHALRHVMRSRAAILRHDARIAAKGRRAAELQRNARSLNMVAAAAKEAAAVAAAAGHGKKTKRGGTAKTAAGKAQAEAAAAAATAAEASKRAAAALASAETVPEHYRDQGFSRPTVLVLLPTRLTALRAVEQLKRLLPDSYITVANEERFDEDFGDSDEEDGEGDSEEEGEGDATGAKRARRRKAWQRSLPADWREVFDGNTDDDFRIGLSFGRRTLKLYADFEYSDIIIASPLGLRRTIGSEGEREAAHTDTSFLASIELLVMDNIEVFEMQNWQHVTDVLAVLNTTPQQPGETDFSRVRHWALQDQAQCFRQTLMFASHLSPAANAAMRTHCSNFAGSVRVQRKHYGGAVTRVLVPTRQLFRRVPDSSLADAANARFEFFRTEVFEQLRREQLGRTLIYFPTYFDFVRVRNLFHSSDVVFAPLSEYTTTSDVSRTRAHFFHGNIDALLFTERFLYFKRYNLRGIRHLVFYGVPRHSAFYSHMLNLLEEAHSDTRLTSCSVIYSRFEALEMERVVGSARWRRMARSNKTTHLLASS